MSSNIIGTKVKESRNFAAVIYPVQSDIFFLYFDENIWGGWPIVMAPKYEIMCPRMKWVQYSRKEKVKINNYLPIQEIALSFTSWSISEAFSLTKQH